MLSRNSVLAAAAVSLVALIGLPLLAADGNAAPDADEYVLTVEGMT